jgi:nitrate reductase NapE component
MAKNNYFEPNKTTLATWMDKTLQQSLKNENIKSRFRVFGILPLNHVAMVGKFGPSDVFTTT